VRRIIVTFLVVAAAATVTWGIVTMLSGVGLYERHNPRIAHGEPEVVILDPSHPFSLDPLPAGWYHRTLHARPPMDISFTTKEGVPAIRLATEASASMLYRRLDISLAEYPILAWRWYIEQPIEADLDEFERAGDDHPARLYIVFRTARGKERPLEVIWGNLWMRTGDITIINRVPHYAARGGLQNVGAWHDEEINLRDLYRKFWTDGVPVRVIDIALFADSDDTKTRSVSYFADLRMKREPSRSH
jgi:hypothetical protein